MEPRAGLDCSGKFRPHRDLIPEPTSYIDFVIPAAYFHTYVTTFYKMIHCREN